MWETCLFSLQVYEISKISVLVVFGYTYDRVKRPLLCDRIVAKHATSTKKIFLAESTRVTLQPSKYINEN